VQYIAISFGDLGPGSICKHLQGRQKWKDVQRNLDVDNVALLYDEHLSRTWQLRRVMQVFPGAREKCVRFKSEPSPESLK